MLTLGQAAKLTGLGKTTITRAIKSGRLSATRRDDGSYAIDPSELSRVYTVTPETGDAPGSTVRHATVAPSPQDPEVTDIRIRNATLEAELKAMRELLEEIRSARDSWRAQAERLAITAPIAMPQNNVAVPRSESALRVPWWPWRRSA